MNELIPLHNTTHLVAIYEKTIADLDTAFELIKGARLLMANTLGQNRNYINRGGWNDEGYSRKIVKQNFWAYAVDKTGLKALLSTKKLKDLEHQLYDERADELPEFTEKAIFDFLQANIEQAGSLVDEAIREVFEWLTPQHRNWRPNYKTNNTQEIGEKVVLESYVSHDQYSTNLNYYRENDLMAIDKLFHLLDGQGIPKYPGNLVTVLRQALQEKQWEAETIYFRAKWYKKGTLHLEFRRMDLVREINKRVGGKTLKKAA